MQLAQRPTRHGYHGRGAGKALSRADFPETGEEGVLGRLVPNRAMGDTTPSSPEVLKALQQETAGALRSTSQCAPGGWEGCGWGRSSEMQLTQS